ncbi:glyoxylate/hydroxypyruvate reductase A [Comamonadaceae bacterium G21597-S1]|nr:glyoxylate/hydroxypyruvate reductase A [Comamonadaceae bacterium G21597-S1]
MVSLLLNHDVPQWLPAMRAAAPDLALRVAPDLGNRADIDAILTWKVDAELLDALPNLQLLYAVGAGVDYLVDLVRQRPHLRIARIADDAVSGDVATLAVAGTLQWFRDLPQYARQQDQHQWEPLPVRCSAGTTIVILGLGRIGCATARAFQALGFEVCGWSRTCRSIDGIRTFAGPEGLRALLPHAQVLVCTLPLTDQTSGIIDAALLASLPRGAFVVNVGRGAHLDESALLAALDTGQVSGAFLDVFSTEPLPAGHALWRHPAVRITPHVASRTQPARVAPQVVENLRRLRAGEPLLNLVDPVAGY